MNMPPGRTLLVTKGKQTNPDTGEETDVDVFLFSPDATPDIIETRLVSDGTIIGRFTLAQLLNKLPPELFDGKPHTNH